MYPFSCGRLRGFFRLRAVGKESFLEADLVAFERCLVMIDVCRTAAEADRLIDAHDRSECLVLLRALPQRAQVIAVSKAAAETDKAAAFGAAHGAQNQLADGLAEHAFSGQLDRSPQVFVGRQVAWGNIGLSLFIGPFV